MVSKTPLLSICIPSQGRRVEHVLRQFEQFKVALKSNPNDLEFCLSLNDRVPQALSLLGQFANTTVKDSRAWPTVRDNLVACLEMSRAHYVLLLGDDDLISDRFLISLLNELRDNPPFDILCATLVDEGEMIQQPVSSVHTLTPAQTLMRLAALPGIVLRRSGINFDLYSLWLEEFPNSVYPQVVLGMTATTNHRKPKVSVVPHLIVVGQGDGLKDDFRIRGADYGVTERLLQAAFLRMHGLLPRHEFLRFSLNLGLWAASIHFQAKASGLLHQDFKLSIRRAAMKWWFFGASFGLGRLITPLFRRQQ